MKDLLHDPLLTPEFQAIPLDEIFAHNAPPCLKREYIAVLSDPNLSAEDALRVLRAGYCYDGFLGTRPDFGAYLRKNPAWDLYLLEDPEFPAKCVAQLREFRAYGDASDFQIPRTEEVGAAAPTGLAPFTLENPPSPAQLAILRELSLSLRRRWQTLWSMYLLEEPGLKAPLDVGYNLIRYGVALLSPRDIRHFSADIAAFTLSLIKKDLPNDPRPAEAIQLAHDIADGRRSVAEGQAASDALSVLNDNCRRYWGKDTRLFCQALLAIESAVGDGTPMEVESGCFIVIYDMYNLSKNPTRQAITHRKALKRLIQYVEGKAHAH